MRRRILFSCLLLGGILLVLFRFWIGFFGQSFPYLYSLLTPSDTLHAWQYFYSGNEKVAASKEDSQPVSLLKSAVEDYALSLKIHPTHEAQANKEAVEAYLSTLKQAAPPETPQSDSSKPNSSPTNSSQNSPSDASEEKTGKRGFTNSGTLRTFWSGSEESTSQKEEIEQTIEKLKELQKNASEYTRPNGTVPEQDSGIDGIFEKFFWKDPLFGGTKNLDPEDY